jgi:hypothetical protein
MGITTERGNGLAPERSYRQRMDALERANYIRSCRAQLKLDVKAGRTALTDQLLAPPAELESMKIFDLLLAAPKWGRVKVNKVLARVKVSPSKTVGGLSERQRRELAEAVRR